MVALDDKPLRYLKNWWNILDLMIVVEGWVSELDLVKDTAGVVSTKILRNSSKPTYSLPTPPICTPRRDG